MSWLDVTWVALAVASATLGLLNLYIWMSRRSELAHLLFFALTGAIAVVAAFELHMMHSATATQYATALRWAHLPLALAVMAMVGFVRFYFRAGRPWLAAVTCIVRALVVVLDFTTGENINFAHISALQRVALPGGAGFAVPVGTLNPWWIVAQLGNLVLLAFLVDASITLWRRGDAIARRRSLLVGGGLVFCVLCVLALALGTFFGGLRLPTVVAPSFLVVALAMGSELGADTLHAAQLSRESRDSEHRSELSAQVAQLALWSWDAATSQFWMNSIARGLFGFPDQPPRSLGQFLECIDAEDRGAVGAAVAATLDRGGSADLEFRVPRSTTRWIATRIEADASSGKVRGISMDVSERRRVASELAQKRDELTHLSRVAALGELAGSLAHEINQPLMAILSNARAAQRFLGAAQPALDEVRAAIADIVEDDRRAGAVIQRLRAMLRKGEIQHAPLDINDVVTEVLHLMRSELMSRGVVVGSELAPSLPPLRGDRIQLQQVLVNLVMNACDAMDGPAGSRRLSVRTRATGEGAEVAIGDSGRGIAAADLERIFEPFVTGKQHGLGLGLSVCRTIINAHGGRLWAECADNAGATLLFVLPRAASA
jgi:two-component system sensor kinase FixL